MAKAAAAATDVRQVVLDIARDVAEHRSAQSDAPYQGDEFEVVDDVDCDADERIDLVPLPQVPTRPFRTELTIERNSIFVANSYSEDFFVRETVRTVDGESERVRLIVGKLDERDKEAFGVLTQSHQDAFYELLKLWGDNGYQTVSLPNEGKVGVVRVSGFKLVTALRAGDDAAKAYRKVREILHKLKTTPIVIKRYREGKRPTTRRLYLLSHLEWDEEGDSSGGEHGPGSRQEVTFAFSPSITQGFANKNIKVLLGGPYAALGSRGKGRRGEIARLLYPWLDYQLATKTVYRARLENLAERFGLKPTPYKSKRKERFARAIAALDGLPIHQERHLLQVSLEDAADGRDFILVARRSKGPRA